MMWLTDAVLLVGLSALTIAVLGVCRLPRRFARIHSNAGALVVGAVLVAVLPATSGEAALVLRGLLVATFLGFTAPVASNSLAKLEHDLDTGEGRGRRDGDDHSLPGVS